MFAGQFNMNENVFLNTYCGCELISICPLNHCVVYLSKPIFALSPLSHRRFKFFKAAIHPSLFRSFNLKLTSIPDYFTTQPLQYQKSAMATAQPEKKERPSALRSIIAGSTAGAVEIGILLTPLYFVELC